MSVYSLLADIVKVAQADAHVVLDVVGHGDGDGDSDQAVSKAEGKYSAIAAEQLAQHPSAEEGHRSQHGVGQMGHAEQQRRREAGQQTVARHLLEAREEEYLLDVLLNDRPANVTAGVAQRITRAEQSMQRPQPGGAGHQRAGKQNRGTDDQNGEFDGRQAESLKRVSP